MSESRPVDTDSSASTLRVYLCVCVTLLAIDVCVRVCVRVCVQSGTVIGRGGGGGKSGGRPEEQRDWRRRKETDRAL